MRTNTMYTKIKMEGKVIVTPALLIAHSITKTQMGQEELWSDVPRQSVFLKKSNPNLLKNISVFPYLRAQLPKRSPPRPLCAVTSD